MKKLKNMNLLEIDELENELSINIGSTKNIISGFVNPSKHMKTKILVFTGAGISAESGLKTFRDNDGLWNNYNVKDVASIDGWNENPELVLEFYNIRKDELKKSIPNNAHNLVSKLEEYFDVTVVTQNVDDLHEKAGSSNIIHLHGDLRFLKSDINPNNKKEYIEDVSVGDTCPDGGQWRPNVVWFGEDLDFMNIHNAKVAAQEADVCIIIGTSMSVYPASSLPFSTKETAIIYYIDPGDINFYVPEYRRGFFYHIKKNATDGMLEVFNDVKEVFL